MINRPANAQGNGPRKVVAPPSAAALAGASAAWKRSQQPSSSFRQSNYGKQITATPAALAAAMPPVTGLARSKKLPGSKMTKGSNANPAAAQSRLAGPAQIHRPIPTLRQGSNIKPSADVVPSHGALPPPYVARLTNQIEGLAKTVDSLKFAVALRSRRSIQISERDRQVEQSPAASSISSGAQSKTIIGDFSIGVLSCPPSLSSERGRRMEPSPFASRASSHAQSDISVSSDGSHPFIYSSASSSASSFARSASSSSSSSSRR